MTVFVGAMVFGGLMLALGVMLGVRAERYLLPTIRKEIVRPWVPLSAVIHDVARDIERAQTIPGERWLWIDSSGVPRVDYVKLAERAVNVGARSAVRRRRAASIRGMLGQ